MKRIDMQARYENDKDFQKYVGRFCETYKKTVQETLNLALVQEVAKYYLGIGAEEINEISAEKSTYVPIGECV